MDNSHDFNQPVAWLFTNVQSGDIEASTDPDDKQGEREYWHPAPLYTSPPAQPAPVQEPIGRTDRQIVDQTEELAVWLLSWCFNHQPETDTPMRESTHPFAERCWAAACHIQEMLTATDPENAVAELDVDDTPPAAQPAPESGSWYAASDIDKMVRDLDVAMNGDGAAPQAKLCDLMPQLIQRLTQPAPIPDAITDNSESPEYKAGFNECRELTIQMRKS